MECKKKKREKRNISILIDDSCILFDLKKCCNKNLIPECGITLHLQSLNCQLHYSTTNSPYFGWAPNTPLHLSTQPIGQDPQNSQEH